MQQLIDVLEAQTRAKGEVALRHAPLFKQFLQRLSRRHRVVGIAKRLQSLLPRGDHPGHSFLGLGSYLRVSSMPIMTTARTADPVQPSTRSGTRVAGCCGPATLTPDQDRRNHWAASWCVHVRDYSVLSDRHVNGRLCAAVSSALFLGLPPFVVQLLHPACFPGG